LKLRTGDTVTVGILGVVVIVLTFNLPEMWAAWLLHVGVLVVYVALIPLAATRPLLRGLTTIGVMFTLYFTLATIPFEAIPWMADQALSRADELLFFGTNPSLWLEPHITYGRLEFFAFIYALFIPYVYLSIFLGLVGRPDAERNAFVTGIAVTYALGFLGYLFVPARGPVVCLAPEFLAPLEGGAFHDTIVRSVAQCGGPHGAFPSLHVALSTYLCFFDLKWNRLRGLTYVPIVLLIMGATVVVRYHYVVDILAGVLVAWVAYRAAGAER
jgi:membrane-associated phospholipid phosphatase